MTRIISYKCNCAYCGNEEIQKSFASSSSFFGHGDIASSRDFSGPFPRYYFCGKCGYISDSLTKKPSEEHIKILESEEYRHFLDMAVNSRYNEYFNEFMLAYTLAKMSRHEEALSHYAYALSKSRPFFNNTHHLLNELPDNLEELGLDYEYLIDNYYYEEDIYINYWMYLSVIKINFDDDEVSPVSILLAADNLRRLGKPEDALKLLEKIKNVEFEKEDKEYYEKERALCEDDDCYVQLKKY